MIEDTHDAKLDTRGSKGMFLREMSRRRLLGQGLLFGAGAGLLAGCGGSTSSSSSSGQKGGGTASSSLIVAAPNTPLSGDFEGPELGDFESGSAILACYDPLIEFKFQDSPSGVREWVPTQFQPRLAESWQQTSPTTWVFKLRQGVKSNYGNELTSADVVYFWEEYVPGRNGLGQFFKESVAKIKSVTAVDKYTVRFDTVTPAPMLLQVMTCEWARPFDTAVLKSHQSTGDPWGANWLNRNTAGFGPYQITEWQPGSVFTMERRSDYYGTPPFLSKVTWQQVPDPSNRLSLLLNGSVGAARLLAFQDLKTVAKSSNAHVESAPGNAGLFLLLDYDTHPWNDVRVRQAVAYAIPYNDIISQVYSGFATPLHSIDVPSYEGYTGAYWVYQTNLTKAKQLVQEAGANGASGTISYQGNNPQHQQVAIALQSALSSIGIKISLNALPNTAFLTASNKGGLSAWLDNNYSWVIPSATYDLLLSKVKGAPQDSVHYDNPQINSLAVRLGSDTDLASRIAGEQLAQKIMMEELPWIPICNEGEHVGMVDSLTGFSCVPAAILKSEYLVPSSGGTGSYLGNEGNV